MNFEILRYFLYILISILSIIANAAKEEDKSYLSVELRTDLWTSIYQNKTTPTHLYNVEFMPTVFESSGWEIEPFLHVEGYGTGRTDLIVGPRRVLVGSDLRNQGAGVRLQKKNEDSSAFDISTEYTSASDEPFAAPRDTWVETNFRYDFAENESGHWLVILNDSKNRGYLNSHPVILPGYHFKRHHDFEMSVGLPFLQMNWFDTAFGEIEASVTALESHLSARNMILEKIINETRFGIWTRAYLHENRTEDDLRLFIEESYIENSFGFKLSDVTTLNLKIGYGFNRHLYEGKQILLTSFRSSTIPSDFYGSAKWEWNF